MAEPHRRVRRAAGLDESDVDDRTAASSRRLRRDVHESAEGVREALRRLLVHADRLHHQLLRDFPVVVGLRQPVHGFHHRAGDDDGRERRVDPRERPRRQRPAVLPGSERAGHVRVVRDVRDGCADESAGRHRRQRHPGAEEDGGLVEARATDAADFVHRIGAFQRMAAELVAQLVALHGARVAASVPRGVERSTVESQREAPAATHPDVGVRNGESEETLRQHRVGQELDHLLLFL